MITADLKLLVDVAWTNRSGQAPHHLGKGEYAAAERLVKRGLLMNGGAGQVGMTAAGEKVIRALVEKVRRSGEKQ
jgi:hypothetical protein